MKAWPGFAVVCIGLIGAHVSLGDGPASRKVVLLAGTKSHGPGHHEYEKGLRLVKHCLDHSPNVKGVRTELHLDGWPKDESTLEDADTIVMFCDGSDHEVQAHPLLRADHLETIGRQMKRGCGFVAIHYTVFVPIERGGADLLDWIGGFFDYQSGPPPRKWYSRITAATTRPEPATPTHPICQGLGPFEMHEEYYHHIRFREADQRRIPILKTAIPGESEEQVVAWAVDRGVNKSGVGRGFGFTGGHFHDNWRVDQFRRMLLNAIVWTAGMQVPAGGVASTMPTEEELTRVAVGAPIRAVIVTGHQYPGHPWKETTPALRDALVELDPRFTVSVEENVEFLARRELDQFDVVVLNYCNWRRPGLSEEARENFARYLDDGGGLVIVHFTNGAFHFSLPEAAESDWPLWRTKICRRVWDHTPGKSGHDAYGPFVVDVANPDHPITQGMKAFPTTDELYFRQEGTEPIEILLTARSQVTGAAEPMAFVHDFGKGRVFQTVLGHDAPSLRTTGTRELVARGAAWAAGRDPIARSAPEPAKAPRVALSEGRFGKGLNARAGYLAAEARPEYATPPLTAECWAKVDSKSGFNILLAHHPKESADHWEIYTYAGSGEFSAYQPGHEPSEVRSGIDVCDGKWHYLAMRFDGQNVELFVDGALKIRQSARRTVSEARVGPLWFGAIPPGLGCDGVLDEVRLSRGLRAIDKVPTAPFEADETTIGLWHFDEWDEGKKAVPDSSDGKNPAVLADARAPVSPPSGRDHFGEEEVGFRWTEQDSRDDRWREMMSGPFFSGTLALPNETVPKAIAIKVGDPGSGDRVGAVCFDTELLRYRVGWTGAFLAFDPARFGLVAPPRVAGTVRWSGGMPAGPGVSADGSWKDTRPNKPWGPLPKSRANYRRLYVHGPRVVLEYTVGGGGESRATRIRESPWLEWHGDYPLFRRDLVIDPRPGPIEFSLCDAATGVSIAEGTGELIKDEERTILRVPGSTKEKRVTVLLGPAGQASNQGQPFAAAAAERAPDILAWTKPGPPRWTEAIVTQGVVSREPGPYVVDTLTLPFDNPYRALLFTSAHDFFANGDAAVATAHGDVWRVNGIDKTLERLEWTRMATGLFQPLGLKIVGDRVHVLGRDQITVLHDGNDDGEADIYENFNNEGQVTPNAHEFCCCLETDSAGNFYYLKGDSESRTAHDGCLLKVAPDGSRLDVVATGIRNGNGLAIGPGDIVTVSPQEGTWTPASAIFVVRPGGFYGALQSHHRPTAPADYDRPLCWIPRMADNSSGGQVWAPASGWGPLSGQLLHFSFGRCRMFLVLRETVGDQAQGGTVELPFEFDSGVMRGRFRPQDGQLYVTGLRGWVSSATRDGCFNRVRYTGAPANLPVSIKTHANGIAISFSRQLERDSAQDPDNYELSTWNYRWTANYGSAEYRPSDPNREGRDAIEPRSATLLEDGKTVFLELPGLAPVMQFGIRCSIVAADGAAIEQTIHATLNAVGTETIEPSRLTEPKKRRHLTADQEARLRPGVIARFASTEPANVRRDARRARLPALFVAAGESPSALLDPGPFQMVADGYLAIPRKGKYRFRLEGQGASQATIDSRVVARLPMGSTGSPAEITFVRGFHRFEMTVDATGTGGAAEARLYWKSDSFPDEPIPATALFHDGQDPELLAGERIRRGWQLADEHRCLNCHGHHEANLGPSLAQIGQRLTPEWIAAWLVDPWQLDPDAHMPRMLGGDDGAAHRAAADLAAFLTAAQSTAVYPANEPEVELADKGEILFEDLGCIACHSFLEPGAQDEFGRRTLHFAQAKFNPGGLTSYLLRPAEHYPATRMPDFHLNRADADALAAHFRRSSKGGLFSPIFQQGVKGGFLGDAQRGSDLFKSLSCTACHRGTDADREPTPPLAALDPGVLSRGSGCLANEINPSRRVPRFRLTEEDRASLVLALSQMPRLSKPVLAESADRLLARLQCAACHPRDGQPGRLGEVLAVESSQGVMPESIPDLTWAGEKLRPDWLATMFAGNLKARPRLWMRARMPSFPTHSDDLATGLAAEHGYGTAFAPDAIPDLAQVGIGRQLSQKGAGFDCRECHGVGADLPTGGKETILAPGINFDQVHGRLREEFYHRFMLDPFRYNPRAKMPKFSEDGTRTKVTGILDGDARRQFAALWQYLHSLDPAAPSEPSQATGGP